MKYLCILLIFFFSKVACAQCNYKTLDENGIIVKQFSPMPIGGNKKMHLAMSISNLGSKDNLLITVRFAERFTLGKNIQLILSDGTKLNLFADRLGDDFIGGSPITHMIFSLDSFTKNKLIKNTISSIRINNDIIEAKTYNDYISNNLKCLNGQ